MKKNRLFLTVLMLVFIFASCKKDKVEPSFVDDYNAPLSEEKGTEHTGDFFPLNDGYSWNYTGREESTGQTVYSGPGVNETEPIDDSYDLFESYVAYAPVSVTLTSGTYSLYPLRDVYSESGYDYRYFEKASDAIYFRAYTAGGTEKFEVENAIFLKIPLVVGDSWEVHPSINLSAYEGADDLGLSLGEMEVAITSKTYVIGVETVDWTGGSADPVRLDERVEGIISVPFDEIDFTGKMVVNMQMTNSFYLLENVGIIKRDVNLAVKSTANITDTDGTYKITTNYTTVDELNLSAYNVKGIPAEVQIKVTNEKGALITSDNPIYRKVIEKSQKVIELVKRLSIH